MTYQRNIHVSEVMIGDLHTIDGPRDRYRRRGDHAGTLDQFAGGQRTK